MAGSLTVKNVMRPVIDVDGISGGPRELDLADYLLVTVDRFSNGAVVGNIRLGFADYAGLEAEWDSGSATTVLEAAIVTEIGTNDVNYGVLTSAQRAFVNAEVALP